MFCDFIVERNERPEAWKHRSIQSIAHRFMEGTDKHIHTHFFPELFPPHKFQSRLCFSASQIGWLTAYLWLWLFSSGVYSLELLFVYIFNLNSEWRYRGVFYFSPIFPLLSPGETCELLTIKLLQYMMGCGRIRLLLFNV